MDGEQRLWRGAPVALILRAQYVLGEGWKVVAHVRRDGEGWEEASEATYDHLTTDELEAVLGAGLLALGAEERPVF